MNNIKHVTGVNLAKVKLILLFLFISGYSFAQEPVIWTDVIGFSVSGNTLTKTAGDSHTNTDAVSEQVIAAGELGYVEYTGFPTTCINAMFGASDQNGGMGYSNLDFAFFLACSKIYILENGTNIGQKGTWDYSSTAKFKIEKGTDNSVKYYYNDALIYTSTVSHAGPLIADVSIYSNGTTLSANIFTGEISGEDCAYWEEKPGSDGDIFTNAGKVGIGTTNLNDNNFNLYVTKGIMSEQIVVKQEVLWPDYVFGDDFSLEQLEDISKYISENKHLPGVPSAEEVTVNGVDVVEMQKVLLEQIEKLYLHMLEQDELIKSLKEQLKEKQK